MSENVAQDSRPAPAGRESRAPKKRKRWHDLLLAGVFLLGLGILLYPPISDYWNSLNQGRAIARYDDTVAHMSADDFTQIWRDVDTYNQELSESTAGFHLSNDQLAEYNSLLNPAGTGMMGHIEIPKIGVDLPIYHTVEDSVLQAGVGHIPGSSLPAGGEGTHVALSGHRGLPTSTLFTNLDKVSEGDVFVLHVLDRNLAYQVDQIRIVEPHEVHDLEIIDGQDYVTLITCTPYAINTHRLLVRGHRVDYVESQYLPADAVRMDPVLVSMFVSVPVLICLGALYVMHSRRKRTRATTSHEGNAS